MPQATTTSPKPQPSAIRWVLLAVLLAIATAVAADLQRFAQADTPITALRTQPLSTGAGDDEGGSVDAFCGFAPCGMPLECN